MTGHRARAIILWTTILLGCGGPRQVILVRPGDTEPAGYTTGVATLRDGRPPGPAESRRPPPRGAKPAAGEMEERGLDYPANQPSLSTAAPAGSPPRAHPPVRAEDASVAQAEAPVSTSEAGARREQGDPEPQDAEGKLQDRGAKLQSRETDPAHGFSPARPRGPRPKAAAAAPGSTPGLEEQPPELGGDAEPLPEDGAEIGQLGSDFAGYTMSMSMLTGGVRVQISAREDFSKPLLDRTYDFADDFDPRAELRRAQLGHGVYWARMAVIDLLGYQFPYNESRRYVYRKD